MEKTEPAAPDATLSRTRARTQNALVDAALRLFSRQGIGATTIYEIAQEAGVSNGSFYNYFRTREDILVAGAHRLAKYFTDQVSASYADVTDAAERVSIGSRRFMLKAASDPEWGAAVLSVWNGTPLMAKRVSKALLRDLRLGRRAGRFTYRSERAAVDLVQGVVLAGMRSILEGASATRHARETTGLVLQGLGVPAEEASEVARRPLPPLPAAVDPNKRR